MTLDLHLDGKQSGRKFNSMVQAALLLKFESLYLSNMSYSVLVYSSGVFFQSYKQKRIIKDLNDSKTLGEDERATAR